MAQQIGPEIKSEGEGPRMLQEGDRFGGSNGRRFLVEGRAGAGGQAMVFRVRDTRLDRLAAAKVSTAHETRQKQMFLERFERELQLSSRVSHPHVLQVYDCGELEGGAPYVLLEWMDRGDLVGFIDRARKSGRHLPYPFVRYYGQSLAAALRAVHGAQMVHRDVKPDNVLIAHDGVAKLTDFGIAKDISPDAIRLTEMGQTMGTLGFMAPEQLAGLPGPQSDIFSFGITFYVLLAGRLPPQKELNAIPVGRILPEAWQGLSGSVVDFLQKVTAPDLENRYTTFDEVLEQLNSLDFGGDDRGLLLPGELPPLPSGAFVTANSGSIEAPAPTGGFEAELARRDPAASEGLGDTMDLTTIDSNQQQTASDQHAEGVGVRTGFETRLGQGATTAPGGLPQRPTDGVRSVEGADAMAAAQAVGQTRAFTTTDGGVLPEAQEAASGGQTTAQALAAVRGSGRGKGLMIAALVVALGAVAGLAAMMSKGSAPSPEATMMALRAYDAAAAQGLWSTAESTAGSLPAAAAEFEAGKVLIALDTLLSGDAASARKQSQPLQLLEGELGARAKLVFAAASRLASPAGYQEAAVAYAGVSSCSLEPCQPLQARAASALAEVCMVAGGTAEACAGMSALGERDQRLAASLVLLEDGHADRAQLVLTEALGLGKPSGGCLENSVLARWASEQSLNQDLRARVNAAGKPSARSAEQCDLFAVGGQP